MSLEEQYGAMQNLLNNSSASMFSVDRDYCYTTFNHAHVQAMSLLYDAHIETGENLLEYILNPEYRELIKQKLDRALIGGEQFVDLEYPINHAGALNFYKISYTPIRDEQKAIIGVGVFSEDVTELTKSREALKNAESQYHDLFETISSAILIIDPDTYAILDANRTACAYYGYSHDKLTTLKISDIAVLSSEEISDRVRKVADGETTQLRLAHRLANGEIRDVEIYTGPLQFKGSRAIVSVIHDISARRKAEEQIEQLTNELQVTLDTVTAGVSRIKNSRVEWANAAHDKMFGYSAGETRGMDTITFYSESTNVEQLRQNIYPQLLAGKTFSTEVEMRRKDGSLFWCSLAGRVVDVENPEAGAIWMLLDITERKQMEDALKSSEEKFRSIVHQSSEGITLTDEHGIITEWNHAAEKITGLSSVDALGQPTWDVQFRLLPPKKQTSEFLEKARQSIEQVLRTGSGPLLNNYEMQVVHPDGKTYFLRQVLFAIKTAQGFRIATISNDITAVKQAEQKLLESEERHRLLFEHSQATMLIVDPDGGEIMDANPAAVQFYGYPAEQLRGMPIEKINVLPPEIVAEERQRALGEKRNFFIFPHRLANGEIRTVEVHSSPILVNGQRVLFSIVHDITERKIAEDKLQESEERFRLLFENMQEGFGLHEIITDENGQAVDFRFLSANIAYERHTGLKPQNIIGKTMLEIMPQADRRQIESYGKVALTGEPLTFEYYSKTFNRHLYVRAFSPKHGLFATIFEDITERKIAEEKLEESEEKYRTFVEQSFDGITFVDEQGNVVEWNRARETLTGLKKEEVVGIPYWEVRKQLTPPELQTPEYLQRLKSTTLEMLQTGQSPFFNRVIEGEMITTAGERKSVEQITFPVKTKNGYGIRSLTRDITARKKAESDLRAAHAELEQRVRERTAELQVAVNSLEKAGRAKDEFLASMSHELRTPLSGILGNAEMLQLQVYGPMSEKQNKSVAAIEHEGRRLLELIKAILDFSELQSGSLSTNAAPCSLGTICYSALRATADSSAKKQQQASFSILPDKIMLNTDERRVQQILVALLNNAIKFTPVGGKFGIDVIGDQENHRVKVTVWDTGIGIKEENLPRLFQPFAQIDARLEREYEGTGLGLALVKQLTEIFGGHVSVESVYGQGSRFTVNLPWVV